jgi:hypothetical protein
MGMMIVRHKVRDYGQWRPIFDRHAERAKLLWSSILRTRRRLRTSPHLPTSKKRWRSLAFWTLRQSISLNQSIKHRSGPSDHCRVESRSHGPQP